MSNVHELSLIAVIGAAALAVNLPLGYLREGARRFSAGWFLWVHLSVPLIAFLRIRSRLALWVLPLFIACAVAGQVAGGRFRRRRQRADS